MNKGELLVELRIAARPYIVFLVVTSPGTIICIESATNAPSPEIASSWLKALLIIVVPLMVLFLGFWLYRVQLFVDSVVDKGFLKFTKRVPLSLITEAKMEIGWPNQRWLWVPTLRPFRRIALYYDSPAGRKYFDVSLTHFRRDKVNELLAELGRIRPDLKIPAVERKPRQNNERRKRQH